MASGSTSDLAAMRCVPCKAGTPPLSGEALQAMLARLPPGWEVNAQKRLTKSFAFEDFAGPLAFVNRIGAVAEREGHHPDIFLAWGKVRLEVWTHSIGGLSESDFVLAAKVDALGR